MEGKYELLHPLSTEEFEALKADIEINGLKQQIEIDEDNNILDGHHRYRIDPSCIKNAIVISGLSEWQKKAYVYLVNSARRNSSPSQKKEQRKQQKIIAKGLAEEGHTQAAIGAMLGVARTTIEDWLNYNYDESVNGYKSPDARVVIPKAQHETIYKLADEGMTQTQIAANYNVTQPAINKIINKIDKQKRGERAVKGVNDIQDTEVDTAIKIKTGEWWSLDRHLLYCGDTSQPEFIDKVENAALAFADPPYGVNKAGWDKDFYWEHDYLIDKAKVVAVTPGIMNIFEFAQLTTMPYKWSIACWKDNGMTFGAVGFGNWEYIALFSNDSVYAKNQDFIRATIKTSETDLTKHESRKPSELLIKLLQYYTKDDDHVVDPFLGSGTTLFACEELMRICIGGEINEEFCGEIIARWEKQTGKVAKRRIF